MANEYVRKQILGNVPARTLASGIDAVVTSLSLSSGTNWPVTGDPFVIAVGRDTASEEKMLVSARVGAVLTIENRGYDGTTAQTHSAGATVEHVLDAATLDQVNRLANLLAGEDPGALIAFNGTNPVGVPGPTASNQFLRSNLANASGLEYGDIPDVVVAASAPSATATVYGVWYDSTLNIFRVSDGATTWLIPKAALMYANVAARTASLGADAPDGLLSLIGAQLAFSQGTGWTDIARQKDAFPRFANSAARDAYYTAPADGDGAYLTGTHVRQSYRNGEWIDVERKLTYAASAPTSPQAGDIWLEPLT